MSLRDVLAFVQQQQRMGARVTPVTPENSMGLQRKPAWMLAVTPVTPVTPPFDNTQANTPKPADCRPAAAAHQQQRMGARVTPVTPENSMGLQRKPAWIKAVTPVTPVTPHLNEVGANAPKPAPELTDCTPAPAAPPVPAVPAVPEHEPVDWHALHGAYMRHHLTCAVCKAAGRGLRYGLRCGVGAALWVDYEGAARAPQWPWEKRRS